MAKISAKLPDDLIKKLSKLGDKTDEIATDVLETGAEIVFDAVKTNLLNVVGKDTKFESRSTGELAAALGVSSVKVDKNGDYNLKIGFSEPHSGGVSNAMLANLLEYGKSGQAPKPFLAPAKSSSRAACIEAMEQKLREEIENL